MVFALVPADDSNDGVATLWTLTPPFGVTMDRILIDYTGACGGNPVGLGFDQFTPSPTDCDGTLIDFESLAHNDNLETNHYGMSEGSTLLARVVPVAITRASQARVLLHHTRVVPRA